MIRFFLILVSFSTLSCSHFFSIKKKYSKFEPPSSKQDSPRQLKSALPASAEDKASFSKGKALYKKKLFSSARKHFIKVQSLNTQLQAKARFFLALTLIHLKKLTPAYEKLEQVKDSYGADPSLILKSLRWRRYILLQRKNPNVHEQLRIQSQVLQYAKDPSLHEKARSLSSNLIQNLALDDIEQLMKDPELRSFYDLFLLQKGRSLVQKSQFESALEQFRELLNYTAGGSAEEKSARQYIQALTSRQRVNPKTIGAVLPLTGSHQRIGQRCLNGLQLGLGLYSAKPSDFKLVIHDSKGNPNFSRNIVKNLFLEHHIMALVGGVASQTAETLAAAAQSFMVPMILLSQKSGITKTGSYIFQNAINSEHIVKTLVQTLTNKQDHKKMAILYPNDPFGVEYANLFWDHALTAGAQITGVQTYKPGETDFNDIMKRLVGTYYIEDRDEEYRELLKTALSSNANKKRHLKLKELLSPVVDFSVLFIPDSIKSLDLIAPYLSFHNITGVTLAGPSLWNSPKLRSKNREESIIFADALITTHPKFNSSSFFKTFNKTFGYKPGLFELLSYESALALREVILDGSPNRDKLRENLSQRKKLSSPVGALNISKNREFIHEIAVFSVQEGKTTPL